MNKFWIFSFILISSSCDIITDYEWNIKIKLNFINESSYTITTKPVVGGFDNPKCNFNIEPGNSISFKIDQEHYGSSLKHKPNLGNINTIDFSDCTIFYKNTLKYFNGVRSPENYENPIQTSEFEFEYTYKFTDESFKKATECKRVNTSGNSEPVRKII